MLVAAAGMGCAATRGSASGFAGGRIGRVAIAGARREGRELNRRALAAAFRALRRTILRADDALETRFAFLANVFVNGHAEPPAFCTSCAAIIPELTLNGHAQREHFSYTARHGKGLRRHVWMVLRELETGLLSGEAGVGEIPQLLRNAAQFR